MAQIIRHRKGVLESVSSATKRKAELLIVTGSSGITSTNSEALIFFGDGTDATAGNKILYGTSTPDLTGASYSTAVDGIPYYNTSENKLYILAKAGNIEVSSNTDGTGIYSGSVQVLADFLTDNANVNVGSGSFTTTGSGSFGDINVSGNATIDGNIVLGGNITIGDASSDTVSFGGEVASDIIPSANNTYDLGSSTDKFAEVHATTIFGSISATNGVISGSSQVVLGSIPGFNTYTGSVDTAQSTQDGRLNNLESTTASIDTAQTAQDARLSALETETGSIDTAQTAQNARLSALETETGSITTEQSAQDARLTSIESFTSSIDDTYVSQTELAAATGALETADTAQQARLTSLETFSGSQEGKDTTLENYTASVDVSLSEINSYTSSLKTAISVSGANLTVLGNLDVQGTTTTVDSTTVNIGDNIIELNGTGATYGGLMIGDVTAPNQVSGSLLWDATNDQWIAGPSGSESKVLLANGDSVVSGSAQVVGMLDSLNSYTASNDTDQTAQDARLSALETETGSIDTAQTAQDARLTALETETGSIDTAQTAQDSRLDQLSTETGSIATEQSAQDARLSALETETGSIETEQAAQDGRLNNIETYTASLDTTFEEKASASHTLISGSSQVVDSLLNQATDFGTGRVSGDNFGDSAGTSTFTGSFNGDGSGLTGLATNLIISGGTGNDEVDLLNDSLTFAGTTNEIETTVTNNQVQIGLPDNVTVGNNLTVTGNLTVSGTTTTVDSTNVTIGDNILELNYGGSAAEGGILVKDATGLNTASGSLKWNSTNDEWVAGALGSEAKILLANGDGVVSGSAQVVDMLTSLNSYTASNDTTNSTQNDRLDQLSTETGSISTEQAAQDSRLDQLSTETGSIATEQAAQDSRLDQLSTETGSIATINTAQNGRLSRIELETGSIATAQGVQDGRLDNIESFTSSIDTTIKTKLDADGVISGSSQVTLGDVNGFTTYSSSVDTRLDTVEAAVGDGSTLDQRLDSLESFSGSQEGKDSTLEAYTASVDVSLSEINSYTSSLKTAISVSGQNVTVAGNLEVQGTTTTVDSTTVQIGDNIIELNGSGAANGGLLVKDATVPNTVSGSLLWDSTNDYWKGGALGSEIKFLREQGDGVVSGSDQVVDMLSSLNSYTASNDTDQTAQDARLTALETETGSIATAQTTQNGRLDNLESTTASIDTAQTAQDARLTALETETGSISTEQATQDSRLDQLSTETGSIDTAQTAQDARLSALETETGSIDTAQTAQDGRLSNIETYTASLDTTFEEKASASHTLVSGSEQLTSATDQGELIMQSTSGNAFAGSNLFSDGADLFSIGTATGNVGDIASGNQLSLYGSSSLSGILSFDVSGSAKSFDYVSSNIRYVDTNTGVSIALKPDASATKSWVIDTDGDLVSNGGSWNGTGKVYADGLIARNDITGSNLKLTGNANIDGNIVLGGNITIGDASSDTVSFGGEVASDIIPSANNTYDLGSSTDKFAEVHATTIYGSIAATNGVHSGSAQVVSSLVSQSVDLGDGRLSADNIGDVDGSSTFTGSFVGDGSGITGLSTTISVSGSDGSNDTVSLLNGALSFAGGTGVSATVATDTVTISVQDASDSNKGIASFASDDFSVSNGAVSIKAGNGVDTSGGVRGANLNADVAGDGVSYNLSTQAIDVDYGSTANTAVEGNTSLTVSGTTNEIEISGGSVTLGSGGTVTIGLPDSVTIATASIQDDLSVGGNVTVTGNLTVEGTTTTIDSTTVNIGDRILELNYGGAAGDAGLLVSDATAPNSISGSLLWDASEDKWIGGALGSEKVLARLNDGSNTSGTIQKYNANGLLTDSVLSDDGTDATFSGDVIISGLSVGTNGGFLYVDTANQVNSATATTAGDVIQWDGSSFVASNELDGGTY